MPELSYKYFCVFTGENEEKEQNRKIIMSDIGSERVNVTCFMLQFVWEDLLQDTDFDVIRGIWNFVNLSATFFNKGFLIVCLASNMLPTTHFSFDEWSKGGNLVHYPCSFMVLVCEK
jgi:hypothetical protein